MVPSGNFPEPDLLTEEGSSRRKRVHSRESLEGTPLKGLLEWGEGMWKKIHNEIGKPSER
jgi:hypothetical protein